MTISKLTGNIQPLDEVDKINEIIDGALENAGTGTNALAIMGTATGNRGVGIGQAAEGSGAYASGLGTGAKATGNYAIQIGYGTNSTASSLNIGFNASSSANRKNWQLLDGTTGLIPDARLSSNIARTTDIVTRNIGEIVASTIPLTDAGLHLLDGALISGSGSYSAFVTYIAGLVSDYPDLFETEANWQQSVTDYGVCGKFVYDSVNNTVRLPKYSNKIYTQDIDTNAPVVGNGISIGLTNGTQNFGMAGDYYSAVGYYPKLSTNTYGKDVGSTYSAGAVTANKNIGLTSDGTQSGIIADLSNITTSLDGYYYIVVATSTKTDIEVDIDQIATDLNGKADTNLINVPSSKGILQERYVNGTSWYRVYSDGWCEQGGQANTGATYNVVFLKEYSDTNYTVSLAHVTTITGSGTTDAASLIRNGLKTTGFTIYQYSSGVKTNWRACGYIS